MTKKTKSKRKKGQPAKQSDPMLTGFEEIAKFFNTTHQKLRVVHMNKKFPQEADGTLKPMKASNVLEHCKGVLRCGELMHMKLAGFPDATTFKDAGKKSKK